MRNWLKCELFALLIFACLVSQIAKANDYSATVFAGKTELLGNMYRFSADIEFMLSPTAKEALQKGIALTWGVIIKLDQQAVFWNTTLNRLEIKYRIQNHALLNQYSVKINNNGTPAMFSTLTAAIDFMSKVNNIAIIDKKFIHQDRSYLVAVKVRFDREALPISLRPLAYFDPDWALSSQWTLWPLVN